MIALIDYDAGNMKSVEKALQLIGEDVLVTRDPKEILAADKVVLPGVGSFGDAMENLHHFGLVPVIHQVVQEQTPFLGICLGLQLLFEKSYEYGEHAGLGLIPGEVRPLAPVLAPGAKVPHMGWNSVENLRSGLFTGIDQGAYVYYVHSFAPEVNADTIATTTYGVPFSAAIRKDNFYGTQFHPEKSASIGAQILQNFLTL